MPEEKMLILAKRNWKSMVLASLFLGALSFLVLVVTQKNFRAGSDLLVVQNQQGFSDYYALSKSADYLTTVLVESIYSEKFLEEVNNTGIVTVKFLPEGKIEKLKEWEKIVRVGKNPTLGMIHVEVFGNSQNQVMEISNAIISVLTAKNYLFLGKGQDIDVRVLNGPIWEKNPTIGNIAFSIVGGFLVGALLSFFWIYYRKGILPSGEKEELPFVPETKIREEKEAGQPSEPDEYEESLKYLERL